MQKRGQEIHAKLLAKISRGDFICEKLDNIRFRIKVGSNSPSLCYYFFSPFLTRLPCR
jgi:hypothetical protein